MGKRATTAENRAQQKSSTQQEKAGGYLVRREAAKCDDGENFATIFGCMG